MLAFFPTLYPDELLYSALARYHIRRGSASIEKVQRELFSYRATACVDLPSSIDSLMKGIPADSGYTAEHFIINHTLFPYYAPFLSPERSLQLMILMKNDKPRALHSVGNVNLNPLSEFIHYCPECFLEDLKFYGEAYWHRTHQLPGVYICLEHNISLRDSSVRLRQHNRFEYTAPSNSNCDNSYFKTNTFSKETMEKLASYAIDCRWLLNNNVDAPPLNWFSNKYRDLLSDEGLTAVRGKILTEKLNKEFLNFYGQKVLNLWGIDIEKQQLNQFAWKYKPISSFLHLLMIRFLCGSIKEFFQFTQTVKPFGMPAWPCLNPVCKQYLKPAILNIKITKCTNTGRPFGQFGCEHCGFTYTRRGPDGSKTDRLELTSIRNLGELWHKRAIEITNANYMNLSGQEKSSWVFKVVIDNLNALPQWLKGKKVQQVFRDINYASNNISKKVEKRSLWLQHIKANPSLI